jgi:hypothetical protein
MPTEVGRKALRCSVIGLIVIAALIGAGYGWYCYDFPYGAKHACLKGLGLSLLIYAQQHDGHFPTGGGCPEASLSLLYREHYDMDAYILSGKTKSAEAADEILERGELLGPDTCDWHYVEGLTLSDDARLALVWDKVGLGHNGERLPGGGHSVWRVGCGGEEVIPESEWLKFLEEQERLMAARTEAAKKGWPKLTVKVRLPSGESVDNFDAAYSLHASYSAGGGSASYSGPKLDKSALRLPRGRSQDDCTETFILSFNGWISKPVVVHELQEKVVPDTVIFEMQPENMEKSGHPSADQRR